MELIRLAQPRELTAKRDRVRSWKPNAGPAPHTASWGALGTAPKTERGGSPTSWLMGLAGARLWASAWGPRSPGGHWKRGWGQRGGSTGPHEAQRAAVPSRHFLHALSRRAPRSQAAPGAGGRERRLTPGPPPAGRSPRLVIPPRGARAEVKVRPEQQLFPLGGIRTPSPQHPAPGPPREQRRGAPFQPRRMQENALPAAGEGDPKTPEPRHYRAGRPSDPQSSKRTRAHKRPHADAQPQ